MIKRILHNNYTTILFLKIVMLLLCNSPVLLKSQTQNNSENSLISKEKWAEKSDRYIYNENYKNWKNKTNRNFKKGPRFNPAVFSKVSQILKYGIWIIILGVLAVFLVLLFINLYKTRGEKIKQKEIKLDSIIENIDEVDLEHLLQVAIQNNMFKEALRFRYLIILRNLNDVKLISWKKDKTNGNYLSEMRRSEYFNTFKSLTLLFERVWYGNKPIDEMGYNRVNPEFDQFLVQITPEATVKNIQE